jgi:signal transduction histidine kinase
VADDRVRDAFTPEEVGLLENLAVQIGVTIANSRIYARMKERDRLASLGAMAAGLAHEVKNPLGAIKGAAQLLDEGGPADPSSREFVGIILEEVDRLNHVVGSFLDYARPHAGNAVPIDINAAIRRTVQIMESQKQEDIVFSIELGENIPRAKIDPEQLRQVLINLIQNAVQAMNGRGQVTIATSARRAGRSWAATPAADRNLPRPLEPPSSIEISVRDTGPGIAQGVLKNLFVPFFTTKAQGTGLGLAISQSVVQNAGGTIQVHTNPETGTTFTVVLPATESALTSTPLPEEVIAKAV